MSDPMRLQVTSGVVMSMTALGLATGPGKVHMTQGGKVREHLGTLITPRSRQARIGHGWDEPATHARV